MTNDFFSTVSGVTYSSHLNAWYSVFSSGQNVEALERNSYWKRYWIPESYFRS